MAQIWNLFPSRSVGVRQWNRGIMLLGGACVAGTFALIWYMRRTTFSKGRTDSQHPNRQIPLEKCAPGKEGSQEMKTRGNSLFRQMKYKEAVDAFSEAIELCPKDETEHLAVCYQNRAAAYEHLGELEKTIEDCTTALELNFRYHKAAVRRAKAFASQGEPEKSLDDYMYAFTLNSSTALALKPETDKVVAEVCKKYIDKLAETRKAIPIREEQVLLWQSCYVNDSVLHDLKNVSNGQSFYHKALDAIRNHQYEEVIGFMEQDLDSGLTDATESLRDYILIIRFSLMKEDIDTMKHYLDKFAKLWAALDDETKIVSTNKHHRAMYYLLCASLKLLVNSALLKEDINRAIEADEENVDVYLSASMLLSESGQLPLALEYLEQLAKLDPKHHLVHHMKANCDLALKASIGDVGGVLSAMVNADALLKANPDADPILHLITGRLYFAAQNVELAKASFQKAAESLKDYSAPIFYLAMVEAEESEGNPEQEKLLEEKMKFCLEKEKANPDALSVLAKLAFQRSEFTEAQRLFEQSISMCPLRSNRAAILPAVTDYVQICALCKAIDSMKTHR